ncbi:helix-turn-helix domain-containing protein (plasmid) [Alicyclobacillus fastidiosus]|uniref:Helix-turn-helix domain-containing protein n=1 Tax=Alicyclobacillus fastidiosus TaxID=392011 RepID=A0ABY6ZQW5_9BACL|nr:helix-turn-helix domain-containing protein [Alicyclobacillus fastidiosus]WAH44988.1 helix-turn-helix domain-containing protein [Alicyclobacillus fastidiosus]GMA66268.1 replication protein [Alicyclobacillus fastidiosus]GMA66317.1 replication protein [Alicyclobacillus fastidiosus]
MEATQAAQSALEHILLHHTGADGWVTLCRKDNNRWKQYHYRVEEVASTLSEWLGKDVYFSQNTFYRPARKIEYIRQLRALYVDVDNYLLNLDPMWTIGAMEANLFGEKIPEPNLIIHSGRGLACVWLIEPVPSQALPLWQAMENYLVRQLDKFGGDAKASDAARVLRLAGTVNSKSGEEVQVQVRHDYRYTLRDLEREYLPALTPKRGKTLAGGNTHHRLYKSYTLHYARMMDLLKLCEMREWDMTNYREITLFLYRYWSCCFLKDPAEALEATLETNDCFTRPLTRREVIKATRSAEKAFYAKSNPEANRIAQEKGYPGAGYNVSNAKLIEWLDITEEEQQKLDTIVGRGEKYRRNNSRRSEARRAAGKQTRDEYLGEADKRRQEAVRMRSQGMTQKAIAVALGVTQQWVSKTLKNSNL